MSNDARDGFAWRELIGASSAHLIALANQRADALGLTPSPNDHRNVVNMLRHDYTNYDGHVGRSKTDRLYSEILDAIARDFPWLASQCATDQETHFARLPPLVQRRRY